MSNVSVDWSRHVPARALATAVKPHRARGHRIGPEGNSSLIVRDLTPNPWIIVGDNGANLSAFCCASLNVWQTQNYGGDLCTACSFTAIQIAFAWQTQNACLEITLLQGDQSTYWEPWPMPFNTAAQAATGTANSESLPPPLCNDAQPYTYLLSDPYPPDPDDPDSPTVFPANAYDLITGCNVRIYQANSPIWYPC
jgi:hypothetical protein